MPRSARPSSQRFPISVYLEPDVLSSFEFSKTHQRRDDCQPEIKLMFAVLSDAIECFQRYIDAKNRRCRKIFAEAETWILCLENQGLFSFEQICEALHLSPSYIRAGLLRWSAERAASKRSAKRIREPLRYSLRLKNARLSL